MLFNIYLINQLMQFSKASNFAGSYPFFAKALIATSAFSLLMSASKYFQSKGAEAEIEYRK